MTLQDYIALSQESIDTFFSSLGTNVSNILAAIITILVGVVVGYILKRIVVEISQAIKFEDTLGGWTAYQKVVSAHKEVDITNYLGELLRWIAIILFIIPAIQSLGILGSTDVLNSVLSYIPNAVLAALFLLLGFVVAWFVHRAVFVVAYVVGNNPASLVANIVYIAIVTFAFFQALLQLGVSLEVIRWATVATIAAFALAIGLGGRDQAMDLIKKAFAKAKE